MHGVAVLGDSHSLRGCVGGLTHIAWCVGELTHIAWCVGRLTRIVWLCWGIDTHCVAVLGD